MEFQKPQVEPLTSSIEHHIRAQPTGCVSFFVVTIQQKLTLLHPT